MKTSLLATLLSGALFALANCGGSGNGGTAMTGSTPTTSFGTITGFGSVFVNGIRFSTSNTAIVLDDNPATESDLRVGMAVTVSGSRSGTSGSATRIEVDGAVKGFVEPGGDANHLIVMGQRVRVDDQTKFENNIVPAVGEFAEVHGLVSGDGVIAGGFIEKESAPFPAFAVKGFVKNHKNGLKTFQIGALTVAYVTATVNSMPDPATTSWNGLLVKAKGATCAGTPVCGTLTASKVAPNGPRMQDAGEVEFEGFVTAVTDNIAPDGDFMVGGQHVVTKDGFTRFEGGELGDIAKGVKLEVEGVRSGTTLTASKIEFRDSIKLEADIAARRLVLQHQITSSTAIEITPTVGSDGTGSLVVYTVRATAASQGDIFYQRLNADGSPSGAAVQVTSSATDDQLNAVSGNHIVFTAFDSTNSSSGKVMVYEISTATLQSIGAAAQLFGPRIHGQRVVWTEVSNVNNTTGPVVKFFDLAWVGTGIDPIAIAGPLPPASEVQIGDRFVVWTEVLSGDRYVVAYELVTGIRRLVASSPVTHETQATTSGPWIVWQSRSVGAAATRIEARNMDTMALGESRVIVNDGALARLPSIDGDLIAYESNVTGNFDIYVHRLSTSETFAVTNAPGDQLLSNVHGNLVAWVDTSAGNGDIFVAHLGFGSGSANNFTLSGLPGITVTVNSLTEFEEGISGLNGLADGDHVRIRGRVSSGNNVIATEVEKRSAAKRVELQGPIQSIDATIQDQQVVTILGIAVNTAAIVFGVDDRVITCDEFFTKALVGTLIKARGNRNGSTVVWSRMELEEDKGLGKRNSF